jgi:outer membrane protein TolC
LAQLIGRTLDETDVVVVPDLTTAVAEARAAIADVRARPEYAQFASTRDRLAQQASVIAAREQPRVSAFARAGYGKPGLNLLNRSFDPYWLAGVQVQWTPWTWGAVSRERESLELEQQIATTNEAAFTESVRRAVQNDLANIDRLEAAIVLDDRIILLRERIERETRIRLQEAVVTAAEYVDRNTDLLQARLARAGHVVELAQSRARLLTTIGIEVR